MKRKTGFFAFALFAILATTGCGSKQPPPSAPAANAPNAAQDGTFVATKPAQGTMSPSSQESDDPPEEQQADSGATGRPSPPTFGGAVGPNSPSLPNASATPSPPASNPAPRGSGSGKMQGLIGGLGGSGAPPIPTPGGPGPGANFAGANPANAAGAPGDNPFEDPANMLPLSLSLRERAINAFKGGNVPRAYGLYEAHLLSLADDERENEMRSVRWDKKRIVPRLGYSFAVGLVLNNTSRQESLKPIGTKSNALGAAGAGNSGFGLGGGGGDSNSAITALRAKELSDAAGKYASKFVEAFEGAHADGKWSEAFRDVKLGTSATSSNSATGQAGFPAGGLSGGLGNPGAKGRQGGAANPGGSVNFGGGGAELPFRFYDPQDDLPLGGMAGGPGALNPGLSPPGFSGFGSPNIPNAPQLDPAAAKDLELEADTVPLASGLSYIGKGDSIGELSKRAIQQHYDALIVFEVDVSLLLVNKTIKNDCRIRVINLRADKNTKEKAIVSASLNNRDVAIDKDPDAKIETAVENILKKMLDAYTLDDLPNFKSESIQGRRLKDLVNDKVRSKLDLLCEIELYATKGLIDNTLKLAAFERIAGADGKDLASKEPDDRIPILDKMIKRQYD